MAKISYARGFPYGAPMVVIRGGATRKQDVKEWLRFKGFNYDGAKFGYVHYMNHDEFKATLLAFREAFPDVDIVPKAGMDANYVIDLDGPPHGDGLGK